MSTDRYLNIETKTVNVESICAQVSEYARKMAGQRAKRFDKVNRLVTYQVGDLVKLRTVPKSDKAHKLTKKFALLYSGPYEIGAIPYANCYTLINPNTREIKGNYNTINIARYYGGRKERITVVKV